MSWLLGRMAQAFLVVLVMTVIVFVGVSVIGDPVELLISPNATQAERLRTIQDLGLDEPLWQQYADFLWNAAQGNLGNSFVYNIPAIQLIFQRMPATIELALTAVVLSVAIGMPLGIYAGLYPERRSSKAIMALSVVAFSVPTFWVGLMLIMVVSVQLGWLPSAGRGQTVTILGASWSFFTLDGLRHLLLPAFNLALFNIALVLRLCRAGAKEAAGMDYVKFARAKGLSSTRIVLVHITKNLLIPVVTVVGLEFGSIIAFSVVTESIFAWPGMGKLIIDSINALDRPVIVAYLMVIVVMFVFINLVVDLTYTLIDPRVRPEARNG